MLPLAEPMTVVIVDDLKRVTSRYVDGSEMVEEFDLVTDEIIARRRRKPTALGGHGEWDVEIGALSGVFREDRDHLRESSTCPVVVRKDTAETYNFRIRNLGPPVYTSAVFSVDVEADGQCIVVRTTNKKYYARLSIPAMTQHGIRLDPDNLSWEHRMGTLLITYKKHLSMRIADTQAKKVRGELKAERQAGEKHCKQQ